MSLAVNRIFEEFLSKKSIFVNKEALSIKYTPDTIPHREDFISGIAKILAPALKYEKPSNIFLFGKTGTGKSLCATYVCSQLSNIAEKKGVNLKILYVNCKLRKAADTEYRLIAHLAREFGHEIPATGLPTDEVYNIFFKAIDKPPTQMIILVLDEVDMLVKKCGDEVLYNLTRINQELKNAKIVIVGISNDIMFTTNLDPRVKSSLNEEEIVFPPYDALQLKDILMERAKIAFNPDIIDETVIAKCAAYAAREHGDARRALDLLRVAGEIAERSNKTEMDESDVDAAEAKIEAETVEQIVKRLPKQSQAVLYSAILILKSREPPVYTGEMYDVYKGICVRTASKQLTQRRVSDLISELDMLGIINAKVISKGRYGRTREISVSVTEDVLNQVEGILKTELGL
jgi:cell division control protein 6